MRQNAVMYGHGLNSVLDDKTHRHVLFERIADDKLNTNISFVLNKYFKGTKHFGEKKEKLGTAIISKPISIGSLEPGV